MSPKGQALIHFLLDWYQGIYSKSTINCYLRQNLLPSSSLILAVHQEEWFWFPLQLIVTHLTMSFPNFFPPPWGLISCLYLFLFNFLLLLLERVIFIGRWLDSLCPLGIAKGWTEGLRGPQWGLLQAGPLIYSILVMSTWRLTRELNACKEASDYLGIYLL
jgi:hypothetical protein